MCCPRRIVVKVAQKLNEKWEKELAHFEQRTDEVRVADSISAEIALDEELGDLAYQALEECLAEGFRGWRAEGGAFVKEIEGVKATFDPRTRKITLAAAMSDVITATVEKRSTVADRFCKELGVDLDLGSSAWNASESVLETEERFRRQLESELEADKRQKIEAARGELRRQVRAELEERWNALNQSKRRELSRILVNRLQSSRAEVECEVNTLLSESYRRALLLLAKQQNGRVTKEEESGSVIDLEITL